MQLSELLNATEEELKAWTLVQDPSALETTFDEIWEQIRTARLYAGQPRSPESERGVALSGLCFRVATYSANKRLMVQSCRMLAYSLTANEQYQESIPYHELAIDGLDSLGEAGHAARARLGYIAALTHTGRYQEALAVAAVAEDWFKKNNDEVGYARLCNNVANLYDRMNRRAEACRYHLAHSEIVKRLGDQEGLAKSYLNLGNTFAAMDQFEKADEMFENCENLSRQLGLTELGFQAGYNRAYLYFLRGRYSDAFRSFSRLREHFEQSGSRRHYALCDLDEAEIYIQLNLPKDAATLARRAADQFKEIGLRYEEAKATAFLAVSMFQLHHYSDALEAFQRAQEMFESEGNLYWRGLLDLYRAEVELSRGRYWDAHALAMQARDIFESTGFSSKTVPSLVLLGRIALALDDVASAESFAASIPVITDRVTAPLLLFPCYALYAEIAERKQEWDRAEHFYEMAADDLEQHQARLHHDLLRVTLFKGRHRVYEALVYLALRRTHAQEALALAYLRTERAKSRGLVDLLSQHLPSIQGHPGSSLLAKIVRLREELNVLYARSKPELRQMRAASEMESVAFKEDELERSLREAAAGDPEYTSLQQVSPTTVDAVQAMLSADTTLVEYFIVRDEVLAFVISRSSATVHRNLCRVDQIQDIQNRLRFHLEEFMLFDEYLHGHANQIFAATQHYLQELHRNLFRPIEDRLRTHHLTIVPHGLLHLLPFHAFASGGRYIIDDFEVSYAPSASVLKYCVDKNDIEDAQPCVIGVSDQTTPFVEQEVQALNSMFPASTLLLNEAATQAAFTEKVRRASFVHIATHGLFRQDNPMFSRFKLFDGWVTALDLFGMTCETNLVTLSGCKSGMTQITGSDDLLGLMRGFLYAGSRSLLLSLWNVDDRSTADLMTEFYQQWRGGASKAKALGAAMKTVRNQYKNPFHWAPFQLIGKA